MHIASHVRVNYNLSEHCTFLEDFRNKKNEWSSTKSEEKPQRVVILASLEGNDEKAQYASSFKDIFI